MRHRLSYEKKKGLYGYGFIALWFIGALMFFIIPVCKSFYYSFNDVDPETGYLAKSWVGIANYKRAFMTDPSFRKYLVSALQDMALNLPIIVIFSMFVAIGRQLVTLLPVAFLLSLTGDINAVWWSYPIAEFVCLILSVAFYIYIYKRKIKTIPDDV